MGTAATPSVTWPLGIDQRVTGLVSSTGMEATEIGRQYGSGAQRKRPSVSLPLSEQLTEYLNRAAFCAQIPLHPPAEILSTPPRSAGRGRKAPEWMEEERRSRSRWHLERPGTLPDPLIRLGSVRRDVLAQRLSDLATRGRTPRVCLYTHAVGGRVQEATLAKVRAQVTAEGWRIKSPDVVDRIAAAPAHRPGWRLVLRLVRAGDIDGVIVPAYDDVSQHLDEYEEQLDRLDQLRGFLLLATPETGGRQ
ncbi:hypothetical protein ACFVP0_17510 [Streptomyces cinereoruber]|uniref:recombinase family protein n=1 Tax=Streptomyces cinereoruber TaxID=67260 RepID=UPI00368D7BFF